MSKTCNKCKLCTNEHIAQIPYIEHKRRMFKAYRRENVLKSWLIGTNTIWLVGIIIWLIAR